MKRSARQLAIQMRTLISPRALPMASPTDPTQFSHPPHLPEGSRFAGACLTCSCSICLSKAATFIFQLFLSCFSCCSTSDFSESSFISLPHHSCNLATSAFCLHQQKQRYCSPQASQASLALPRGNTSSCGPDNRA